MRTLLIVALFACVLTIPVAPVASADVTEEAEGPSGTCYLVRPGEVPPVEIYECPYGP